MAPMIKKEDGRLDWSRSAGELERRLRAFTPWPGAFCTFDGGLLKVAKAAVGTGTGNAGHGAGRVGQTGSRSPAPRARCACSPCSPRASGP